MFMGRSAFVAEIDFYSKSVEKTGGNVNLISLGASFIAVGYLPASCNAVNETRA